MTAGSGPQIDDLEIGFASLTITVGDAPISIATSPGGTSTRPTGAAQEELTCGEAEQIDLLDDEIQAFTNVTCSDGANVQYQWYEARDMNNRTAATPVSTAAGGRNRIYQPSANSEGVLLLRQSRCADDPTDGGIWQATSFVTYVDLEPVITPSANSTTLGETITLAILSEGSPAEEPPVTYTWFGGNMPPRTGTEIEVSPTATTIYRVEAKQGICEEDSKISP